MHTFRPQLSRRQMLAALPALVLAPRAIARGMQTSPTLPVERLLGFGIRVSDPGRSVEFYQGLFGMPVQARRSETTCLRIGPGPQFMSVSPTVAGEQPSIHTICISAPNFNVDRILGALENLGIARIDAPEAGTPGIENPMKSWVRIQDGGTPELYFSDARGLVIQLQDPTYCGGSGTLGNACTPEPAPSAGLVALEDLSHFTVFGSDGDFYQSTMGFMPQAYQATTPALGVGDGIQFLMFAGGGGGGGGRGRGGGGGAAPAPAPASIHHASFNMKAFDTDALIAALESRGLTPGNTGPLVHYISLRMPDRGGAEGGTPEFYFRDPDGLLMQIQDTSYCGGGGLLGDICQP